MRDLRTEKRFRRLDRCMSKCLLDLVFNPINVRKVGLYKYRRSVPVTSLAGRLGSVTPSGVDVSAVLGAAESLNLC